MRHSFSLHRATGHLNRAGGFALTGRQFFQHRLTGAHELPQAGSPLTGGSFSAPADRGTRTALAGSPFPGGEFFAEPQRGIRRLRTAGACRALRRGQKGRDTCGFPSSLNSYLSLGDSTAKIGEAGPLRNRGMAVGLPLRVFLRLFAVHRQRTATQTVESAPAQSSRYV